MRDETRKIHVPTEWVVKAIDMEGVIRTNWRNSVISLRIVPPDGTVQLWQASLTLRVNDKKVYEAQAYFTDTDSYDAVGTSFKQLFSQFEKKLMFEAIAIRLSKA